MRLLEVNANGSLVQSTFIGKHIPSYGILSHTWETNGQEVTFQDLQNGEASSKSGYRKILFCADQARKDGLSYFWVDSCNIDKSNSTELHEAINSMFRWYQNAAKCYAYLSDVSAAQCTQPQWQPAFVRSRWFTRGWTLQELLAPPSVEFFSYDGERLGNRDSLKQQINEATGIALQALEGKPLSQFPIDERMSWAAKRETTIEEDQIYCLLGIFDIYLPLIYGEGKGHAFRRLKDEIDRRSSLNIQETSPEKADRDQRVDDFLQLLYNNACPYEDRKNRNRERVEGTCNWFTNHDLFKKWNSSTRTQLKSSNLLFVTADPGCGKSVLCRYLVDQIIPDDATTVCYFFFKDDFEDQKNSLQALCTMLHQLLSQNRHLLSDAMLEKYGAFGEKFVESFADLWSTFVHAASHQRTVCVIDALDECHELDRNQLIEAVTTFSKKSNRDQNLKFLLTSRPYEHIRRQFGRLLDFQMSLIHLQGDSGYAANEIAAEIEIVMGRRVDEVAKAFLLHPDERKLIQEQLKSVMNRTYLWVTLVFDGLMNSECRVSINKDEILALTTTLPQSVYAAYEKILGRSPHGNEARRILHIILGANRPLSVAEMSIALAFQGLGGQQRWVPLRNVQLHLRNLCGLFVTIVDDKVYLLHQTAREFLVRHASNDTTVMRTSMNQSKGFQKDTWKHSMSPEDSNSILAEICISYLHSGIAKEHPALLEYSALFWPNHYQQSGKDCQAVVADRTRDLCRPSDVRTQWAEIHNKHAVIPATGPSICLAAALGLDKALDMFLREQTSPSLELTDTGSKIYDYGQTPLSWAAWRGHEAVVRQLLNAGADVMSVDKFGQAPLSQAALGGHDAVVKQLLDAGADIESMDKSRQTPLSDAARKGHEAVVKQLLEAGAVIDAMDHRSQTPLSEAARRGHENIVKQLLNAGANVEMKDNYGQTPLMCAAQRGHEAIVKQLLEAGADVDSIDTRWGETALSQASQQGHDSVVKRLLEAGADVDSIDTGWGQTALSRASQRGHEAVVKLLLGGGAGIESMDNYNQTPLSHAVLRGHDAVVQLLLEAGDNLESIDNQRQTPLSHAAQRGHEAVVKKLLVAGSDLESKSESGLTPLSYAAHEGYEAVVERLLEAGADVESRDNEGLTPLSHAAQNGHKTIVKQLLEAGAEVDSKSISDRTPLSYATEKGYKGVIKYLLEAGADIKASDNERQTPLSYATQSGSKLVVKQLLEASADIKSYK